MRTCGSVGLPIGLLMLGDMTGLVQDVGGYTTGVANTMATVFDATAGVDVIFTDAQPSWVTGQTYAITGPLTTRVTSVLCAGMPEGMMAQCLAQVAARSTPRPHLTACSSPLLRPHL